MKHIRNWFFLLAVFGVLMAGCHQQTTVILPPDTRPDHTTQPSTAQTTAPTTEPATAPTTLPSTIPTTAPAAEPSTEPTTQPSEVPTTLPATVPTTAPVTEPTTAPATEPDVYDISGHVIGTLEREILSQLNACRTAEGLPALTLDHTLSALAAIRANECTQALSSLRPDGRTWESVLADYGYNGWGTASEIRLCATQGIPADILVDTWMNTGSSRNSILSTDPRCCGIGLAYSGSNVYIVTIFAG